MGSRTVAGGRRNRQSGWRTDGAVERMDGLSEDELEIVIFPINNRGKASLLSATVISVCPSVHPSVHSFVRSPLGPSLVSSSFQYVRVRLAFSSSVRPSFRPSGHLIVLLLVRLSDQRSVRSSVRPSVCPFVCPSGNPYTRPSVHQFFHPSTSPSGTSFHPSFLSVRKPIRTPSPVLVVHLSVHIKLLYSSSDHFSILSLIYRTSLRLFLVLSPDVRPSFCQSVNHSVRPQIHPSVCRPSCQHTSVCLFVERQTARLPLVRPTSDRLCDLQASIPPSFHRSIFRSFVRQSCTSNCLSVYPFFRTSICPSVRLSAV